MPALVLLPIYLFLAPKTQIYRQIREFPGNSRDFAPFAGNSKKPFYPKKQVKNELSGKLDPGMPPTPPVFRRFPSYKQLTQETCPPPW